MLFQSNSCFGAINLLKSCFNKASEIVETIVGNKMESVGKLNVQNLTSQNILQIVYPDNTRQAIPIPGFMISNIPNNNMNIVFLTRDSTFTPYHSLCINNRVKTEVYSDQRDNRRSQKCQHQLRFL